MLLLPTACSGLTIPQTNLGTLKVAPVGMGTLNFPLDKTEDPSTAEALRAALGKGVNLVDTAEAYGFGKSEELTRWALREAQASGEVAVATKFAPVPWRQSADDVVAACKASRERLGVEQIDLYQIHFPDIIQPLKPFGLERRKEEEYWDGLARCVEQGLVANVGVSNYGPTLVRRAHEALARRGVPLVSNQINLSLMYRKAQQPTLKVCEELGVRVLGYFPLANGLLAGKYDAENMPAFPKSLTMKKYVAGGVTQGGVTYPPGGATPLIRELRAIGGERGVSAAQVAINWVVAQGAIPIPGARNAAMAAENAAAMEWALSADEALRLEAAADAVGFEFSSGGFQLE